MDYEIISKTVTSKSQATIKIIRFYNEKESVYVVFTESDQLSFRFLKKGELEFDPNTMIWYTIDTEAILENNYFEEFSGYIYTESTEFEKEVCEYCKDKVKAY